MNSFEVFWRHYVFIINIQFITGLIIFHSVTAATNLCASTAVCTVVHFVETQVAFSGNSHAQSTMAKHFYSYEFSFRTADITLYYLIMDIFHLIHRKFACKHHNVCVLRIKLHSRNIGNITLCGNMYFHAHLASV